MVFSGHLGARAPSCCCSESGLAGCVWQYAVRTVPRRPPTRQSGGAGHSARQGHAAGVGRSSPSPASPVRSSGCRSSGCRASWARPTSLVREPAAQRPSRPWWSATLQLHRLPECPGLERNALAIWRRRRTATLAVLRAQRRRARLVVRQVAGRSVAGKVGRLRFCGIMGHSCAAGVAGGTGFRERSVCGHLRGPPSGRHTSVALRRPIPQRAPGLATSEGLPEHHWVGLGNSDETTCVQECGTAASRTPNLCLPSQRCCPAGNTGADRFCEDRSAAYVAAC